MNSDTIIELVEKVEQSVNDLNEIIYAEKNALYMLFRNSCVNLNFSKLKQMD